MTSEEFDKIASIKKEIDCLEKIIYGEGEGDLETFIESLNVKNRFCTLYGIKEKITEVKISKDFSNAIIALVNERLKKLKKEFNNFKTE